MKKLPALVREESLKHQSSHAGFLVPVLPFRFWRNIAKTHTLIWSRLLWLATLAVAIVSLIVVIVGQ
jgi:hypothetical protein